MAKDMAGIGERANVFLVTAVAVGLWACALSNAGPQYSAQETDLKVRIIPDKTTFVLHEKVFTKVEFTNSGSKTYCFPKPWRDCTNDYPGSAVTTGRPVTNTGESDQFICHYDSRGPRGANLESEIKQDWVKVAPNAVYLTESAEAKVDLNMPGEWQLETTYQEPQAAFNSATVKKILTSAAERAGCTIPTAPILSEVVTIHVVAATKDH